MLRGRPIGDVDRVKVLGGVLFKQYRSRDRAVNAGGEGEEDFVGGAWEPHGAK